MHIMYSVDSFVIYVCCYPGLCLGDLGSGHFVNLQKHGGWRLSVPHTHMSMVHLPPAAHAAKLPPPYPVTWDGASPNANGQDQGSMNGVHVNGQRISGKQAVWLRARARRRGGGAKALREQLRGEAKGRGMAFQHGLRWRSTKPI